MKFCNIEITDLTRKGLFCICEKTNVLIPLNAECIVKSNETPTLLSIVNKYKTTIDGQIPLWIFKLKFHNYNIEKISGSDIIYVFASGQIGIISKSFF